MNSPVSGSNVGGVTPQSDTQTPKGFDTAVSNAEASKPKQDKQQVDGNGDKQGINSSTGLDNQTRIDGVISQLQDEYLGSLEKVEDAMAEASQKKEALDAAIEDRDSINDILTRDDAVEILKSLSSSSSDTSSGDSWA